MRIKWIENILNLIFWGLTSWLVVSVFSIEIQEIEIINGKEIKQVVRNSNLIYFFSIGQLFFAFLFYVELYFIKQLNKTSKLKPFLFKSITLIFLCIGIYYLVASWFLFSKFITFPNVSYGILLFYVIASLCYGFIKMWIYNEQDKKQFELIKKQAELSLLKTQLQPHFLFNTLNNLLSMVDQVENPKLAKSIDKLSGLLRYVVYETKKQKVTIKEEIEFIKSYVELHLLSFELNEIDFNLNIKGKFNQQKIEPGILLCYVENAFKHGVFPEEKSFIHIDIDLSIENIITFQIENSIPEITLKKVKGGSGMELNQERLKIAYPNKHKINITVKEDYYLELIIHTDESYNY